MNPVNIRLFEPKYRDDLIFMVLEAKNALGRVPGLNEDLLDIPGHYVFDRGDRFWIATDEQDRVVGSVGCQILENTGEAALHRLYVKAGRKRQGIGSALLKTAEQYLLSLGLRAVVVHLGEEKTYWESRLFYPKHGFYEMTPGYMRKELQKPELWDIYDENRRKTGRTVMRGCPMQTGDYHLVVHVWIQSDDGRFLISRRSENKHEPLLWETTGGSAIAGEDSLTAALREVQEELGVELIKENGILFAQKRRDAMTFPDFVDVWVFRQKVDLSQVVLQPGETCDARLESAENILKMQKEGEFVSMKSFPYLPDLFAAFVPEAL